MTGRKILIEPRREDAIDDFVIHESVQTLIESIFAIDGIADIGLDPYEIDFGKARLFDINDIVAGIIAAFAENYADGVEATTMLTS